MIFGGSEGYIIFGENSKSATAHNFHKTGPIVLTEQPELFVNFIF